MKRNPCLLMFFSLMSFCFFMISALNAQEPQTGEGNLPASVYEKVEIIRLTDDEIRKYETLSLKEQLSFLSDFYVKNKEIGATDGQIINEMLRLDMSDGKNSDLAEILSKTKGKFKDFKSLLQATVDDINNQILEKHPGEVDKIINLDDRSTWSNIKYMAIAGTSINDLQEAYKTTTYYSETYQMPYGAVRLASCANLKKKEKILMSFIVVLKPEYTILRQFEGEPLVPITVDFSGSENVDFSPLRFPLVSHVIMDGRKTSIYKNQILFTFDASILDKEKEAVVKASLSFQLCKDSICIPETTPEIYYQFPLSAVLETPICSSLQEADFLFPERGNSLITFRDAAFKKGKNNTYLYVSGDLPLMNFDTPQLYVANENGLFFEKPFLSMKNRQILFRSKLLNPEKLENEKSVKLTLTFLNIGKATEVVKDIPVQEAFFNSFDFSFLKMFSAFFFGIKFAFFTPLLLVLSLFFYQMLMIPDKTAQRSEDFALGLWKGFLTFLPIYGILFVLLYFILPEGSFVWGNQLKSPFVNFFIMSAFLTSPVWLMMLFQENTIRFLEFKLQKVLRPFNIHSNREMTGFLLCLIVCASLLFSPMVGMYFNLFDMLKIAPVTYTLCFLAGVLLPFFVLFLFSEPAADVPYKKIPFLRQGLFLQSFVHGFLFFLLLSAQAGRYVMLGTLLAFGLSYFILDRVSNTKKARKRVMITVGVLAVLFVPFTPNRYNFNNFGAMQFNQEVLEDAVNDGKAVYLNITESSCLSCQFNRLSMIYAGGRISIQKGNLIVMSADYNTPYVKDLLKDAGALTLPANLIFGPAAPQGMLLPEILRPSDTSRAVSAIFSKKNQ